MSPEQTDSTSAQLPKFDPLRATAHDVVKLIQEGDSSIRQILDPHLAQIARHDAQGAKLQAILSLAPDAVLNQQIEQLEEELRTGKPRSALHGVPLLIKDNIVTSAALGMDTTCGAFVMKGARGKRNAPVVDRLLEAGLLIFGKTNLSEWAGRKGHLIRNGWSSLGGQTQAAYVRDGFAKDDKILGHSAPGGSSSGSAVAVAAGFAPISVGTETDGSIIQPAGRASLYGLKASIGFIPVEGTSPWSDLTDSIGPMAKNVRDLATLFGIMAGKDYTAALSGSWLGKKIAFVNPDDWELSEVICDRNEEILTKTRNDVRKAMDDIEKAGATVVRNVVVPQYSTLTYKGEDAMERVWDYDYSYALADFMEVYHDPPFRTMAQLVKLNEAHAEQELPPDQPYPQESLTDSLNATYDAAQAKEAKDFIRKTAQAGFEALFSTHGVSVVAGPLDSRIGTMAAAAGYPAGAVPLGYADNFNARAYGMVFVAAVGDEDKILGAMSAWESLHPELPSPPPMLMDGSVTTPDEL